MDWILSQRDPAPSSSVVRTRSAGNVAVRPVRVAAEARANDGRIAVSVVCDA